MLSNDADFDRVDAVRAGCDAILVGAATVRNDNPRLLVRCAGDGRTSGSPAGLPRSPIKVTVTEHGAARHVRGLLHHRRLREAGLLRERGGRRGPRAARAVATVVDGGQPVDMARMSEDLYARGVHRLMVEGGGTVHTQFLTADLADELHLVVAPFFVGDSRARRFVGDGRFPWNPDRRATLAEVRQHRRRGAAAVRALDPVPADDLREPMPRTPARRDDPYPGDGAAALRRRLRHDRAGVHLRRPGRRAASTSPSARGSASGSVGPGPGRRAAAGPAAQRVPHRRRLRQPALRLRPAAARGGRAHRRRRRLPAVPAAGGARHRPLRQARRLRPAGRRASTPTKPTWRSATPRTSATTPSPRRCCSRWVCRGWRCSATTRTRSGSCPQLGVAVTERVPTDVHLSAANAGYLAAKARHGAHALDVSGCESVPAPNPSTAALSARHRRRGQNRW